MKRKSGHNMPVTAVCEHENFRTRVNNSRHCFLLLLCTAIFGFSKAEAAPRIWGKKLFTIPGVNHKEQLIAGKQQAPEAILLSSSHPAAEENRRYQSLQIQRSPPLESHTSLDPSMLRSLDNQLIPGDATVGKNGVLRRRILSSEKAPEMEEARSHEYEREYEHASEHVQEEGNVADTAPESGEEDEEEADEEGEEEDERSDSGHSEEVGEKASLQRKRTSFDSVNRDYHTVRVRPNLQSTEEVESRSNRVDEAAPKKKSSRDGAGEDSSSKAHKPRHEKSDKRPKTGSKNGGNFRGVPGGSIDGANITHISNMLYKIVKKYDIKTVLDIPCRNNLNWFPELLHQIDFEVIGFRYLCVDEGAEGDEKLQSRFSEVGSPEFLSVPPTESYELPKSDLVFSYDGPQQWGVRKTWAFFTGLRKVRPKYILVTNNPGQMNHDEEHTLNLRKQPFHFAQAMRVISNVATSGKPKQLLFYETESIREGF